MYTIDKFGKDFQNMLNEFGTVARIKYFNMSGAGFTSGTTSDYDDAYPFAQSGNDIWCSGVFYNLSSSKGSDDAILLEQGKVTINDSVLWINGSIITSGNFTAVTVGIGSPVQREYANISPGVDGYSIGNNTYLKGFYMRTLTNGSLYGA